MFHKNKDAKTGSKPQETGEILRGEVVELHNDKLLAKGVLMDRDESRKRFGLNGDVLAVIEMPPSEEGFRKQIGIVDFGKNPEGEKHNMMWDPQDNSPIKIGLHCSGLTIVRATLWRRMNKFQIRELLLAETERR